MGTRRTPAPGRRDLLVARRKLVGLSQEALAAQLQIDRTTVARWERGGVTPALWMRPMLADALQVNLNDLADLLAIAPAPGQSLEHDVRGVASIQVYRGCHRGSIRHRGLCWAAG